MKRLFLVLLVVLTVTPFCFAEDISASKWKVDLELYTEALNKSPKDFVTALNLSRKWVKFSQTDLAKVREVTGNAKLTVADMQAVSNNIYREAAQVICKDYVSLMEKDPLGAANYAINVQAYFRANPEIMAEFSAANNSNVSAMKAALDEAVRVGVLKTYKVCAKEYSRLNQEGKHDEAKKLSEGWQKVVSTWEAQNSPLPQAFRDFAGIDPTETLDNMKRFEEDYAAWHAAVNTGDEEKALSMVAKWVKFEKENPGKARDLGYLYTAINGGTPDDKTNWDVCFHAATYIKIWKHDVAKYSAAIAAGDLDTAKKLIAKWEDLIAGPYGEAIAKGLGSTKEAMLKALKEGMVQLESVDPAISSESVSSFKKDLEEYGQEAKKWQEAEVGSEAWYKAAAKAVELADKWSRIAEANPALASEIKRATGVGLPAASDGIISHLLKAAAQHSAVVFNDLMGKGKYTEAVQLIRNYQKYFDEHPRVKKIASALWGDDVHSNLARMELGLTIIAGDDASAGADDAAGSDSSDGASDAEPTGTAPGSLGVSGS